MTGLLVATESPRALAGAIKRLIEDQQLRARLGAAAMTRARRDFDITLCADQMLERFHSALAASRTSAIARRLGPVTLRPYLHVLGARARTRASFRENDFAP